MARLEVGTVLLQWATGGMLAGWVTTRHRVVGTGYGWLVRGSFLVLSLGGVQREVDDAIVELFPVIEAGADRLTPTPRAVAGG